MSQTYYRGLPVAYVGRREPVGKSTHVRISVTTRDRLLEYRKKHMLKRDFPGFISIGDIIDILLDNTN